MSDTKLYEEIDEYAREHKTVEFGEWSAQAFAMHKQIERLRDVDVQCGLYSYNNDLLATENARLRAQIDKIRVLCKQTMRENPLPPGVQSLAGMCVAVLDGEDGK